MIREIPKKDMKICLPSDMKLSKEFKDGVFCICGNVIKFKNRKPHETVKIICPDCNFEIVYGC